MRACIWAGTRHPAWANWSLFPILFLIAWTLAATLLPAAAPGYTAWGYGCRPRHSRGVLRLLAGPRTRARACRAQTRSRGKGIVLWLFGGVAQLQGDTPTARAELQVAAAGPAASLAIAAIMALASWLLGLAGISSLLVSSLGMAGGYQRVARCLQPAPGLSARRRQDPASAALAPVG